MKDFIDFLFAGNSLGWNIFIGIFLVGMLLIFLVIIVGFLYWVYAAIGFAKAKIESENGVVTNKYYHGDSTHTGFGMTTNGQMAVTTSYEDEEYIIEYKSKDGGKKYRIETDEEIYDKIDIGDKVRAFYKVSTTTHDFEWTGDFEKI